MQKLQVWLKKVEANRPFREREAWGLFRLAALGEAVGWTLLITGILLGRSNWSLHAYAVPIAGQLHGLLFLFYFGILIATFTSLRWSHPKLLIAAIAGVLPYGTLVFEQWAAWQRRNERGRTLFCTAALTALR